MHAAAAAASMAASITPHVYGEDSITFLLFSVEEKNHSLIDYSYEIIDFLSFDFG